MQKSKSRTSDKKRAKRSRIRNKKIHRDEPVRKPPSPRETEMLNNTDLSIPWESDADIEQFRDDGEV